MNESCLTWMSHVPYAQKTMWYRTSGYKGSLQGYESCLIWMSHVSYEWVMSHMNESCLTWMSHVPYEQKTTCCCISTLQRLSVRIWCPLQWMSHLSYKWVMCHMIESRLTRMSHVACEQKTIWCRTSTLRRLSTRIWCPSQRMRLRRWLRCDTYPKKTHSLCRA